MHDPLWRDASGRLWRVSDMDTRHIENCLRRMQQNPGWRRSMRARLIIEIQARNLGLTTARTPDHD